MKEENRLSTIYHPLWNKFNKKQFSKATSLFAGRLMINGFDLSWFKGKKCLDAGCGSGRYIKAMLDLGAKEVVGIDLDIKIARKNIKSKKVKLIKGDIRKIPYKDEYFDFVCCNGVLHHTKNPKKIINELSRVLKKDGFLFLYVFDKKTQDWELIDELRKVCKKFKVKRVSTFFKDYLSLSQPKLFAFIDLLYAPIQHKFTRKELNKMLKGYKIKYLDIPFTEYDKKGENRLIAKKMR